MLLGRANERARIARLLADTRAGTSGVVVVRGDPGIGKAALLRQAAEHAGGMSVLSARGVQSETEVPFSGLPELTAVGYVVPFDPGDYGDRRALKAAQE